MQNTTVVVALFASVGICACAASHRSTERLPAPVDAVSPYDNGPCLVVAPSETRRDTIVVVAEGGGRPWSVSGSSRLVLAQLYQPLVRVTCQGVVVPELAERWSSDTSAGPGSIQFTLRNNTRFSDAATVTHEDVRDSWLQRARMRNAVVTASVDSQRNSERRTIAVTFYDSDAALLTAFGQISRAVAKRPADAAAIPQWPRGSGLFVVDSLASSQLSATTVLRPAATRSGPVVLVREDSSLDHRDLLDRGVDVLQSRDPVVLDYARRIGLNINPLPFDRTYVLAIPSRSSGDSVANISAQLPESDVQGFRAALAQDAVRIEARAAASPLWWHDLKCDQGASPLLSRAPATQSGPPRIMYDAGDPVARALAERIVAIVRNSATGANRDSRIATQILSALSAAGGRALTAVPTEANVLRAGSTIAYVRSVPARVLAPCAAFQQWRADAEWLTGRVMFPLIESRSFLVTRSGVPGIVVDWDGTLRVLPSAPSRGMYRP